MPLEVEIRALPVRPGFRAAFGGERCAAAVRSFGPLRVAGPFGKTGVSVPPRVEMPMADLTGLPGEDPTPVSPVSVSISLTGGERCAADPPPSQDLTSHLQEKKGRRIIRRYSLYGGLPPVGLRLRCGLPWTVSKARSERPVFG